MIRKTLLVGAIAALGLAGSVQAATYDLAFILDKSGSIGSTSFTLAKNSLAAALTASLDATALSQNSYNISVVTFHNTADTVVESVLVSQVSELAAVTSAITGAAYGGGTTNYTAAFNELNGIAGGVTFGAAGSIINMMTDGDPVPFSSTIDGQIVAARDALITTGWDSLSFEAVKNSQGGAPDSTYLAKLAFDTGGVGGAPIFNDPGLITDPLNNTFVLEVSGFGDAYDAAIKAKVAKVVNPDPIPVPASLPLLIGGLGMIAVIRRRRKAA